MSSANATSVLCRPSTRPMQVQCHVTNGVFAITGLHASAKYLFWDWTISNCIRPKGSLPSLDPRIPIILHSSTTSGATNVSTYSRRTALRQKTTVLGHGGVQHSVRIGQVGMPEKC